MGWQLTKKLEYIGDDPREYIEIIDIESNSGRHRWVEGTIKRFTVKDKETLQRIVASLWMLEENKSLKFMLEFFKEYEKNTDRDLTIRKTKKLGTKS